MVRYQAGKEKDLGVTFSADMTVSDECEITAKGYQILELIRRTIRTNNIRTNNNTFTYIIY